MVADKRVKALHARAKTLVERSNTIYKYYVSASEEECYEKFERRERLMDYAHKQVSKIDRILRKLERSRKNGTKSYA
ncbi:MAG: hypothetical protein LBH45_07210 [Campylobacteraceae bacterium]|jgi:hypothetical protein|nr:hypothetical protein [Campylobacteraceae bacterium]